MPALDSSRILAYAQAHAAQPGNAAPPAKSDLSLGTAFHDLLDIVNPLQHLPVIGTLYRAISGDTIGTVEKIAGDTLYGGLWGAVSSVADTAFEAVTGKDFGATVLAFVTGGHGFGQHDAPVAMAANTAATPAGSVMAQGADIAALTASFSAKGLTGDLPARALYAYRQSQGQSQDLGNTLPLALN